MHSSLLLPLAGLLSFACAAPKAAFSLDQVHVGKKFKNGPLEVAKTHLKYGKAVPDGVLAAATTVQSGSATASPQAYNEDYLVAVQIGTPAQTITMDFDTGSSDFWVFSNYTPSSQRSGHAYYSPGSSSSAVFQSGKTWDVQYGDGSSSSGVVWADTVVIGGVTATSQAVECATGVSSEFVSNTQNDGLVGLAFDVYNTCTPGACATFMENVVSTLPSPLFASYLKNGVAGAYDFGYINSNHYTGSITYTPVTSKGYWEFSTTGYAIGTAAEVNTGYTAIVDTGTSLIYLPAALVKAYYAKVSGSSNSATYGGYVYPCSSTLPSLTIYISGVAFTVPGSRLTYAPESSRTCFGALQSSASIGINILGDAFINNFYIIFDYVSESAPSQIGFATQK